MSKKYPEFSGLNLPQMEAEILASWKSEQAFEQSVALREGKTPFVFYEGLRVPMECRAFTMLFPEL